MSEAISVVKDGFKRASDYASDAWNLVQSYINSESYTAFHSLSFGPVNIELDPALTSDVALPNAPNTPSFPTAPEIVDNFVMPDMPNTPSVNMPTEPTLRDHVIPDFNSNIGIPTFAEILPEVSLDPVQEINIRDMFVFLMADYKPALSEIKEILLDRIINGGTGLPAEIEDEIWQRNQERDELALQDAVDAMSLQWEKMGFTMPDGLLAGSIADLNTEYLNKRLDTSREIAIKQAELEQTNVNNALALVADIEKAYNSTMVQYAQVGTEAMKVAADVAIGLFNTVVQYHNLLIERYKAKADVFKTLIEARLGEAEVYKATVDGIGKAIDADNSKIQLYLAQVSAEEAKLKAYATELQGIIAKIDALKAWLDMGKTRMEVYAAETRALTERYTGEIEAYKSQVTALAHNNESKIREKDISLREQIAEWDIRLKEYEFLMRDQEQETNVQLERLRTLTQVGAHVVAGALAASHTAASISESEDTVLSGSV